ncbi:IS4 family transposase [Synergistales bacterium]|nr:IS4 family transposase [Synergistales bacterium]
MSYIIKQRSGKYTYLMECTAFRNASGKPDNKKIPIGKVDPVTGAHIYKSDYIERMRLAGTPVEIASAQKAFSAYDIKNSYIREYGMHYLLCTIATRLGLTESLASALPKYWQEVFMLACYLVSSGDPFSYCEEWISNTESLPVGNMSSQRISELLSAISHGDREGFYQAWCAHRCEEEYLALDITSASSYSELVDDVEWGYNRDNENLNICMLMGETSHLPVYQTVYSGSLKDVSTLKTTLSIFDSLTSGKPVQVVMDKGFYSKKNVDAMLCDERIKKFIIPVPFTSSFAIKQVDGERKDIDSIQNTIVVGGESMRAVTKERAWSNGHKVFTHIYYSALKALHRREDLYSHAAILRDEAEAEPQKWIKDDEHTKYLIIRRAENSKTGYTVNVREEVIDDALKTAGWVVIISNKAGNAKDTMRIYRAKDVVEKGFLRLKRSLDLGRLRAHSQENMQNKVFVGFIALIMLSELHSVMSDKELYKKMTMKHLGLVPL